MHGFRGSIHLLVFGLVVQSGVCMGFRGSIHLLVFGLVVQKFLNN